MTTFNRLLDDDTKAPYLVWAYVMIGLVVDYTIHQPAAVVMAVNLALAAVGFYVAAHLLNNQFPNFLRRSH